MSSDDIDECISALAPWDVIWPFDKYLDWPHWKMWVCLSKEHLGFLRINTKRYTKNCVPLSKKLHPWLIYDSFLGCGGDLVAMLSELELKECLEEQKRPERRNIIGSINPTARAAVRSQIQLSDYLPDQQKEIISEKLAD
ncbi:MAG: hypothetical protein ISN29_08125 [Gammaproteobacteria bacterium AqS3]|nr:hypothetical protein [Gammaproteobacteria bacterium AqS3]